MLIALRYNDLTYALARLGLLCAFLSAILNGTYAPIVFTYRPPRGPRYMTRNLFAIKTRSADLTGLGISLIPYCKTLYARCASRARLFSSLDAVGVSRKAAREGVSPKHIKQKIP